jgi:hypothetical protein
MSVSVRASIVVVFLPIIGCTSPRHAQLAPRPDAELAGSYQLSGRIDGRRITATVQVEDSARVSMISTSLHGTLACEASKLDADQLIARCGSVEVQLIVAGNRIADVGRLGVDAMRRARKEADLFGCLYSPPDQLCQLPPQAAATPRARTYGRVKVARVSTSD